MTQLTLKKLFAKDRRRVLEALFESLGRPVAVLDNENQLVFGSPAASRSTAAAAPVLQNGNPVGWVTGSDNPKEQAGIASILTYLLDQEAEKKALASEVLERYRELNLMYRLSSRLITSPHPEVIARLALDEACPLIQVASGMVLLRVNEDEELQVVAACGRGYQVKPGAWDSEGVIQRVLHTGTAELSNSLPASQYFTEMRSDSISMLCAPLKTEKRSVGVILAVSDRPDQFTASDLKLLNAIAMQTAPAIEIARLHQVSLENARMEQELKMAYKVQADLLPRKMPRLPGWQLATYWQPARMVSGDFYDFIRLPDGRLGIVIGDVTDKGMPAALVMANTRSVLRAVIASAARKGHETPGKLLARANNLLCEDMPQKMFVTCQLAILEPESGRLCYANAGHPLPYLWTGDGLDELCAAGMPLGLMPRMTYEDKETILNPGDRMLMYSDGLSEAHNPQGEMFGTEHLRWLLSIPSEVPSASEELIRYVTGQLAGFTGPGWEQEDDVTLLVLERLPAA